MFVGGITLLSGCSLIDEVARVADEAKYAAPIADEGVEALEDADDVNIEFKQEEPEFKERQTVLLQYGQYFAERFQAPENSQLIFKISVDGEVIKLPIETQIQVFTSSEYEKFKKGIRNDNPDRGTSLNGERYDEWHIYDLPSKTTYALVISQIDLGSKETTPTPANIQLTYGIYA